MGCFLREKAHAVCIPYPAQGHITPMLKLAKLLHSKGFYVTFVNTDYNHQRLLMSRGWDSLMGTDDFRFESIPDGLQPSDCNFTQDIPSLSDSTSKNCLAPFRALLCKLNGKPEIPRVSCIVSDGAMSFTLEAAAELQVPEVLFWTTSACGFMCYLHYHQLIQKGITPFKDENFLTNGSLDTQIDWIPGMKDIRLRDIPSFMRTTDHDDVMLNFVLREVQRVARASAVILNTFNDLERDVLLAMSSILPRVITIGPLSILSDQIPNKTVRSMESNLWKEDTQWMEWLEAKRPKSVVYVNFGSITVMTPQQLVEFAWGLAHSNQTFLWVVRTDLVQGQSAVLPPEFVDRTRERGLILSWVPQERVISHPSIGGFLTHCGWNSTLESVCCGVPIICWPFFAEQQTNCRFACTQWGIGMEIDNDVKRDGVEALVREIMEGEKGKEMRNKAVEWKESAEKATAEVNFIKGKEDTPWCAIPTGPSSKAPDAAPGPDAAGPSSKAPDGGDVIDADFTDSKSEMSWWSRSKKASSRKSAFQHHGRPTSTGLRPTPAQATVVGWILRDGMQHMGKLICSNMGARMDSEPKRWRILADVLYDMGTGLEVLSPLCPHLFVEMAGLGNFAKGKQVNLLVKVI